jgi:hypothetical protein
MHKIRNTNIAWSKDKQWPANGTIRFGISLSQKSEKKNPFLSFGGCLQPYDAPPYRETDSGFKTRCVILAATFTRFGTQRYSPLLDPKSRSTWKSLQVIWRGKEAVHDCVSQQPKCFCGSIYGWLESWTRCVERVGELHWRSVSLYCAYVCDKSLCIISVTLLCVCLR